jgi:hypothetical protein
MNFITIKFGEDVEIVFLNSYIIVVEFFIKSLFLLQKSWIGQLLKFKYLKII